MDRFSAIDIGTVTCRLLVAESDGVRLRELAHDAVITNLGEGVDASGVLLPAAMQRVYDAVDGFLRVVREFGIAPESVFCMATSASRDASNAAEFAAGLTARGVKLSVIPGTREAALSFLGAARDFVGQPLVVVDIGGGSTEIIAGVSGENPLFAHSFNIGCRRVTERFFAHDAALGEVEVAAARAWIRAQFEPYFAQMRETGFAPAHVVCVAGTATSMVSIREAMEVYDSSRVHGAVVTRADLDAIAARLFALPLDERQQVVGLQPQRAAVINGGVVTLQEVLRAAGCECFVASESDILQGIVLTAASGADPAAC